MNRGNAAFKSRLAGAHRHNLWIPLLQLVGPGVRPPGLASQLCYETLRNAPPSPGLCAISRSRLHGRTAQEITPGGLDPSPSLAHRVSEKQSSGGKSKSLLPVCRQLHLLLTQAWPGKAWGSQKRPIFQTCIQHMQGSPDLSRGFPCPGNKFQRQVEVVILVETGHRNWLRGPKR